MSEYQIIEDPKLFDFLAKRNLVEVIKALSPELQVLAIMALERIKAETDRVTKLPLLQINLTIRRPDENSFFVSYKKWINFILFRICILKKEYTVIYTHTEENIVHGTINGEPISKSK